MSPRRPRRSAPSPASFQVGPGMWVRLRYEGCDADGEPIEAAPQDLRYLHGVGQLLPRIEAALEGSVPGDVREVTLAARDAWFAEESATREPDRTPL